jgi:hypothetical protein
VAGGNKSHSPKVQKRKLKEQAKERTLAAEKKKRRPPNWDERFSVNVGFAMANGHPL